MTPRKAWLRSTWQMGTGLLALAVVVCLIKPELVQPLYQPLLRQAAGPRGLAYASLLVINRFDRSTRLLQNLTTTLKYPSKGSVRFCKNTRRSLGLGNELFQSARDYTRIMPELRFHVQSEMLIRLDAAAAYREGLGPITDQRWPALVKWFQRNSNYNVTFEGFDEADRRFKELAGRPARTEAESEELQLLVRSVGRNGFKFPMMKSSKGLISCTFLTIPPRML